jgi:hypothetical protein
MGKKKGEGEKKKKKKKEDMTNRPHMPGGGRG